MARRARVGQALCAEHQRHTDLAVSSSGSGGDRSDHVVSSLGAVNTIFFTTDGWLRLLGSPPAAHSSGGSHRRGHRSARTIQSIAAQQRPDLCAFNETGKSSQSIPTARFAGACRHRTDQASCRPSPSDCRPRRHQPSRQLSPRHPHRHPGATATPTATPTPVRLTTAIFGVTAAGMLVQIDAITGEMNMLQNRRHQL